VTTRETDTQPAPPSDEAAVVDYLRERDVECPLCRYNLRGLSSSRCPECGRELRLGVWLAEPRQAAWVTGLVPLLLAAGIGVLFLIAVIMHGWPSTESDVLNLALMYFITALPLSTAWIWSRRRFLRLGEGVQWLLAWAAIVSFAAALVGFLVRIND